MCVGWGWVCVGMPLTATAAVPCGRGVGAPTAAASTYNAPQRPSPACTPPPPPNLGSPLQLPPSLPSPSCPSPSCPPHPHPPAGASFIHGVHTLMEHRELEHMAWNYGGGEEGRGGGGEGSCKDVWKSGTGCTEDCRRSRYHLSLGVGEKGQAGILEQGLARMAAALMP